MLLQWMILKTLKDFEGVGAAKSSRGTGVSLDENGGSELGICKDDTME